MIKRAGIEHIDMLAVAGVDVLNDLPNYARVVCDPEHTRKMLKLYIELPSLGCFFKEVGGKVVGIFMGIVSAPWFTPNLEMSELMFWVHPEHRNSTLAFRLISTVEQWATEQGATRFIIAAASGYETARVEKLYHFLGYKTNAVQCCKEI